MSTNPIRRVAILGAGVMGAQIAAHCINTRIPVILFDLETPTEGGRVGLQNNRQQHQCS